jgi:predicted kinase
VLVDATFREDRRRREFLQMATGCGLPAILLRCRSEPEAVRGRLAARRGDASDADWKFYLRAAAEWELESETVARATHEIATDGTLDETLEHTQEVLLQVGLVDAIPLADQFGRRLIE